jgi:very-short-patch-repair endonuclease
MKKPLVPFARQLRSNPTEAEKCLWQQLRYQALGVKFRRQAVVGKYIVDFVCFGKKLVIELDGGQHSQNQQDIIRDAWLKNYGFQVLRFWNSDVLANTEGVIQKITEQLPPPEPSPHFMGEGPSKEGN